jgi:very-short-patch-repair endonuclease
VHVVRAGDSAVGALASAQHGVVSRRQLALAGLGRGAIEHRLRQGRLHVVHRGVYLVGHRAAPPWANEAAALLACGDGAALSHATAAVVWRLLDPGPADGVDARHPRRAPIEVTVPPGRRSLPRQLLRPHRTRELGAGEVAIRHGLRVTSPARTLLDLSATASERELRRAVEEALRTRLATAAELAALVASRARRPGTKALRELVTRDEAPALTRSEAEERLLELVRGAGLPAPVTNVRVGGYEVDALWRDRRLIVEVDGFAFHSTRAAFERDRRRDADLQALGYRVLRLTWRALQRDRDRVIAQLAQLLAAPPD